MANKISEWRFPTVTPLQQKCLIIIILIFGALLPFYPLFLSTQIGLFYRDLSLNFYPSKVFFWDSWHQEGRMPIWNPFAQGGMPYLGDLTTSPFHPANFLLLLFPRSALPWAFSLWIVIHYSILASGFYLLLRSHNIAKKFALLCSLSLTWSGPFLSSFCLPHTLGSFSFIPWFFYFLQKHKLTDQIIFLFGASLFLALSFFCGDPQQAYIALFLMPFLFGFDLKNIRKYLFIAATFLLLILPQLIPTLLQLKLSVRWQNGESGLSPELRNSFSFHPQRFLEWIWPHFNGSLEDIANFRGQNLTNTTSMSGFFIWDAHMGFFIILAFVMAAVILRKKLFQINLKWIIFSAAFFWLAMGIFAPISLFKIFDVALPGWKSFRYPERMILWGTLFLHLQLATFLPFLFSEIKNMSKEKLFYASCIFLLLLQGLWIGQKGILFTPLEWIQPDIAVKKIINAQNENPDSGQRIYSIQPSVATKKELDFSYNGQIGGQWDKLLGNISTVYQISDSSGYFTLTNLAKARLMAVVKSANLIRWAELMGTHYFIHCNGNEIEVRLNPQSLPLYSFPKAWQEMPNEMDALHEILRSKKTLADWSIFQGSGFKTQNNPSATIKELLHQFSRRNLSIMAPEGARLLWNETYDPGWSAYLEGKRIPIEMANTWAMSIALPPSASPMNLELKYDHSFFAISWVGPLLWLLWFVAMLGIPKLRPIYQKP